jgi:hypothetical protein
MYSPNGKGKGGVCVWRHGGQGTNTNLFIDRVALSKNKVTAEQSRKKGIMRPLPPAVQLPLKQHERLVDRDKLREIRCVKLGRAEYSFETC